ncbi:hypothetical protein K6U06_16110 [Acidiferrimicrobium sp. IK]|uniref:hypothetical protein n=1 Tax=Acidiferrimicrobium sp. IK TaxID=2871700 RepID=UPI0021CB288F|nr:hypothetical protein [Acidiferrimicrobium sp. IK]MCU4185895.1 hypothetical protein [Acidiferrimicrobium sp. IK]
MSASLDLVRSHRDQLLALAAGHGISNIRIITAGAGVGGDPDVVRLLVDTDPRRPGIEFFAFAADAEDLLATRVEVGTSIRADAPVRSEPL